MKHFSAREPGAKPATRRAKHLPVELQGGTAILCQNLTQNRRMLYASSGLPNNGGHSSGVSMRKIVTKKIDSRMWQVSSIKYPIQIQDTDTNKRIWISRESMSSPAPGHSKRLKKTWRDGAKSCALRSKYRSMRGSTTHTFNNQQIIALKNRLTAKKTLFDEVPEEAFGEKAFQLIRRCGSAQLLYADVHGGAFGGSFSCSKNSVLAACRIQTQLRSAQSPLTPV